MQRGIGILAAMLVATGMAWLAPTQGQVAAAAPPAGFHGVIPARILDTRPGSPTIDGQASGRGPLGPGVTSEFHVTGRGGVPATGVGAVVVNLTATNATALTYITAWPAGAPRPLTSNLNPAPGETKPNAVVVAVGAGGDISLFNALGSVDLIVDVTGWFDAGGFNAVGPTRILDTRTGLGAPQAAIGADASIDVQIGGVDGVPTDHVSGVILSLTATESTATSFVTAWPTGIARPFTSNLNTAAGQNTSNLVMVGLGAGGKLSLYNFAGDTHLVADIVGWLAPGVFTGVTPTRLLDTRDPRVALSLYAQQCETLDTAQQGVLPSTGVGAVVVNVTATEPNATSYITVWPSGVGPRPLASNVNTVPGANSSNLVVAPLGAGGRINLFNLIGSTDVVVDVTGWLTGDTPPDVAPGTPTAGCLRSSPVSNSLSIPPMSVLDGPFTDVISDDGHYLTQSRGVPGPDFIQEVVQYDVSTQAGIPIFSEPAKAITGLSASGDGAVVAWIVQGTTPALFVWNRATGTTISMPAPAPVGFTQSYVGEDGTTVTFGGSQGPERFDVATQTWLPSSRAGCLRTVSVNGRYGLLGPAGANPCTVNSILDFAADTVRPITVASTASVVVGNDGDAYVDTGTGDALRSATTGAAVFPFTTSTFFDLTEKNGLDDSFPMASDASVVIARTASVRRLETSIADLTHGLLSPVSGCGHFVGIHTFCSEILARSLNGRVFIEWLPDLLQTRHVSVLGA